MRQNGHSTRSTRVGGSDMAGPDRPGPAHHHVAHPFTRHANAIRNRTCVKCGKPRDHPIHDAEPLADPLGSLFPLKATRVYEHE